MTVVGTELTRELQRVGVPVDHDDVGGGKRAQTLDANAPTRRHR
jgi:hypothetical protein